MTVQSKVSEANNQYLCDHSFQPDSWIMVKNVLNFLVWKVSHNHKEIGFLVGFCQDISLFFMMKSSHWILDYKLPEVRDFHFFFVFPAHMKGLFNK